ncbi:Rap1a/Tai family immunity protein [Pseudomonas putida]|uniref:Rap1a/Tai family immunity protein n=1 Tax=Pseudomonas putida TaxID=303 RepID=UPI001179C640|nr:Rap1a/Tai family immunity protein [Pseudomonas putida]
MKASIIAAITTALLTVLPVSGDVKASELDGNGLLLHCQALIKWNESYGKVGDHFDAGNCQGVLVGTMSLLPTIDKGLSPAERVCMPNSVSYVQAARIVVKWLKENPKYLDEPPGLLVILALRGFYPCS